VQRRCSERRATRGARAHHTPAPAGAAESPSQPAPTSTQFSHAYDAHAHPSAAPVSSRSPHSHSLYQSPKGAQACSHGCSDAALSVAQPVDNRQTTPPPRQGRRNLSPNPHRRILRTPLRPAAAVSSRSLHPHGLHQRPTRPPSPRNNQRVLAPITHVPSAGVPGAAAPAITHCAGKRRHGTTSNVSRYHPLCQLTHPASTKPLTRHR
jgi:hypothetical protein